MKYSLFIVFLVIGISHGFWGPIGQIVDQVGNAGQSATNEVGQAVGNIGTEAENAAQSAENLVDNIKGEVENVIGTILNIANGIKFSAIFLWDSIVGPAFDMIISGGQLFFNDQFGAFGGNKSDIPMTVPENPLMDKYDQLAARLKSNVHHLYEQLFLMEQEALMAIEKGEQSFEERIRAFHDKINAIKNQLNEWALETKNQLEVYARTIEGDWTDILNQYNQNIDSTVTTIVTMFQQLTENLMKNFLDFVQSLVPNAQNTIENMKGQGLLPFFRK